ncbi:hypothetical protein JCM10213_008618 [Rhodosporidiobolus nylandii]
MSPAADTPVRRITRSSSGSATPLAPALPLRSTKRTFVDLSSSISVKSSPSSVSAEVKLEVAVEQADSAEQSAVAVKPKKRKRRKGDYADLGDDPLTDRLKEGLLALACGENPGVRTAELRLHYASPANHFYKCLHAARLTPSVLSPDASPTIHEDHGVGITNLVKRPSLEASELTKHELEEAVPILLAKVAKYRPRVIFFVGMKVCETVMRYFLSVPPSSSAFATAPTPAEDGPEQKSPTKQKGKAKKPPPVKAQIGWQSFALLHPPPPAPSPSLSPVSSSSKIAEERQTTLFYCLPSTSGRVAAYPLPTKLKIWSTFGDELDKLRPLSPSSRSTRDMLEKAGLALPREGVRFWQVEELGLPELGGEKVGEGGVGEVKVEEEVKTEGEGKLEE